MRTWIFLTVVLPTTLGGFLVLSWIMLRPSPIASLSAAEPEVHDVVTDVLAARADAIESTEGEIPYGQDNEINILALGLDSRKEGWGQHCDAIHMVTLHLDDWTMDITSVPRGTYAYLPGKHLPSDYYLANACSFEGLDYGIAQIEKVVGVKADYVATVGFSQALGIFRLLDMPPTETLQWLRHRQSYQIGDPQRSQNQAVFMKDVSLNLLDGDGVPTALLYILYQLVDTDMDFATAKELYAAYHASNLADRPEDITLIMKPHYDVQEIHLDVDGAEVQVQSLVDRLRGRLSKEDLSLKTEEEMQVELVAYLESALLQPAEIDRVFAEQLWRQVADEAVREQFNYQFLVKYVALHKATEHEEMKTLVSDYILEKQFLGLTEWQDRGRGLLSELINEE